MGCDIHLYVEAKIDGIWKSVDNWETDKVGDQYIPYEKRFYTGRNYNFFSILADVRNDSDFVPISQPKGLPEDISPEVKYQSNIWDGDGHSHSYLTIQEILSYNWTQTVNLKGFVSALSYFETMRLKSPPDAYCEFVGGNDVQIIKNSEMEEKINQILTDAKSLNLNFPETEKKIINDLQFFYTEMKWSIPYYKCSSHFWSQILPKLLNLGNPQDVRLVFWFDN